MPRKPVVATESTRPKIERKAKQEASERMEGKLESLKALPLESASPKKTRPVLRKSKSKLRKKTTYKSMVKKAILENYNRKGTYVRTVCITPKRYLFLTKHRSVAAISKYIIANYDVPEESFKRYLKASLAKQVESGLLVKKSVARYQLSAKAKPKKKKQTSEEEKTTKRKTAKQSTKVEGEKKPAKKSSSKSKKVKESTKVDGEKKTKKPTSKSKKDVTKETVKKTSARGSKKEGKTKKSTSSGRGKASSAETTEGGSKLVWVWQYYDNGFYNYDTAASEVVEGVYQEYLTSPFTCDVRAVKSGQWEYEIDFRVMTQRNIKVLN